MIKPFSIIFHALRLWWRDWIGLMLLNILWFGLQIPIVTGPPATAVLYTITYRIHEGEYWEMQELWTLLRELFWPAWRWALPNVIFLLVLVGNFYAYQNAAGAGWMILRLVWGTVLVIWLLLNLFYWPFWLSQEDKSWRTTVANCGRFLLLNPWTALVLFIFCAILITVSVLVTVPLAAGAVCLLALVGVTAVQRTLKATQS